MTGVLLLLACPAPEALARFPDAWECDCQIVRCREHLGRLAELRRLHGHQGGHWDRAREETEARLAYWRALERCHAAATWEAEGDVRRLLEGLKQRIGPERFLTGWRPPEMPMCEAGAVGGAPVNAAGR